MKGRREGGGGASRVREEGVCYLDVCRLLEDERR